MIPQHTPRNENVAAVLIVVVLLALAALASLCSPAESSGSRRGTGKERDMTFQSTPACERATIVTKQNVPHLRTPTDTLPRRAPVAEAGQARRGGLKGDVMALMYPSGAFVPSAPHYRCETCGRIVLGEVPACPYCGGSVGQQDLRFGEEDDDDD